MHPRAIVLALTLAMAGATSALADDACQRPSAPAAVDGATATMDQLLASKTATITFLSASDAYQDCVIKDISARRAAAKAAKTTVDPATLKALQQQIDLNQADKEAAGKNFNAAAKAYKAAHPG